jgi:hypothetical protein
VSFTTACSDNATSFCAQLSMCSPYLLQVQYGDMPTCVTRLSGAYCTSIVTAKGSGWTPSGLEACVTARSKLSCTDFFYGKPQPKACMPAGTLSSGGCMYDSQCGTGYCRLVAGTPCGNCVQRGNTGAVCATNDDCDGNLVCAGMACAAPAPVGATCNATTPCENGVLCVAGKCALPGGQDAGCGDDAGNACDPDQGVYCSAGSCTPITVGMLNSLCGGPSTACVGSGSCQGGFCTAPVADGMSCDAGPNCTIPSTCNGAGTCATPDPSTCK